MNTCSSCKFFGTESDQLDFYDEDGSEIVSGFYRCAKIIHGNAGYDSFRESKKLLAVVTDGSGYAARLNVKPDFGCLLHEGKYECR